MNSRTPLRWVSNHPAFVAAARLATNSPSAKTSTLRQKKPETASHSSVSVVDRGIGALSSQSICGGISGFWGVSLVQQFLFRPIFPLRGLRP